MRLSTQAKYFKEHAYFFFLVFLFLFLKFFFNCSYLLAMRVALLEQLAGDARSCLSARGILLLGYRVVFLSFF
jgi:hypothetical protein